jgi:hypothetical protein
MTTLIILTVVVLSSSVIAVLMLYAIGKIRSIEETTKAFMAQDPKSTTEDKGRLGPFNGLQSKELWEMLAEKNVPAGVKRSDIEPYREQYAPALLKNIKLIFSEGCNDRKFGQPRSAPKNDRQIKTLRLSITSWLPPHELSSLYNIGYDSVNAENEERARLRLSLDEVVGTLFSKIKLPVPAGLADSLLTETNEQLSSQAEAADQASNKDLLSTDQTDNHHQPNGSTSERD